MPLALEGLRILDLTTLYPGPMATVMLADLGADVLRVEAPDRPDLLRYMPPYDASGEGATYRMANRNKRSIALNLKTAGGVAVMKALVQQYDIVIEQFRPGVLDRLGVGYDALRAVQPRLIWCAISSYGQTGPWRDRPGHDINFMALSGIASHTGRPESGPVLSNALIGDVGGGSFGAITGILAAVIYRMNTGAGQFVDISMGDGALWMNGMAVAGALAGNHELHRGAGPLNGGSAYDYYRCRDGGWLAVGALEPKFWNMFCSAIGHPELEDHDAADAQDAAALKARIADAIAQRDLVDWEGVFSGVACCVDAVRSTREAMMHPQYAARQMVVDVPLPEGGTQRQLGNPIHLSACPPRYDGASCSLGAHTREVLREIGFGDTEIEALRTGGALG